MTCADVERVLPEMLENSSVDNSTFQNAFQIHLRSCPDCAALVSDLKTISQAAQELGDSEEPSPRVWLGIAAQLRAEGIIREPGSMRVRPQVAAERRGAWWLIPVAAALLAGGAYFVSHKTAPTVAKEQSPTPLAPAQAATQASVQTSKPASTSASVSAPSEAGQSPLQVAANDKQPSQIVEAESSAGDRRLDDQKLDDQKLDDQKFLSEVSTRAPSMRETYQTQLQTVNAEIQEVESYLQRNPGDLDARQHLMDAYQQKALLYQIALDRIQ